MGKSMIACHLPDGKVVDIIMDEEKWFEMGYDIRLLRKQLDSGRVQETGYTVVDIDVLSVSGPKELPRTFIGAFDDSKIS